MKLLLSIILFTVATVTVKAQDYVITVKGDSIPCSISTPLFGSKKYKTETSESKKMKPEEIREYYIARKNLRERAVYKDSTGSPSFMTVIEKGRISLYEVVSTYYANGMTRTTTDWYVSKNSDYVTDLKTSSLFLSKSKQKRKDIFGEMLKDNQAVYDKYIADDKFSFTQIRNLVHLYNTGQLLEAVKDKNIE